MLEYGSGGSTLFAARCGVSVIAVETSRRFTRELNYRLNKLDANNAQVIHCDVGPTERWGWPVDTDPTEKNVAAWRHYLELPWQVALAKQSSPELVLVDGRFRVACVAYSAAQIARLGSNASILLDDYERENYAPVETICRIEQRHGRLVNLRVRPDVSRTQIEAMFRTYLTDIR
jgi:hypothetical protein